MDGIWLAAAEHGDSLNWPTALVLIALVASLVYVGMR